MEHVVGRKPPHDREGLQLREHVRVCWGCVRGQGRGEDGKGVGVLSFEVPGRGVFAHVGINPDIEEVPVQGVVCVSVRVRHTEGRVGGRWCGEDSCSRHGLNALGEAKEMEERREARDAQFILGMAECVLQHKESRDKGCEIEAEWTSRTCGGRLVEDPRDRRPSIASHVSSPSSFPPGTCAARSIAGHNQPHGFHLTLSSCIWRFSIQRFKRAPFRCGHIVYQGVPPMTLAPRGSIVTSRPST